MSRTHRIRTTCALSGIAVCVEPESTTRWSTGLAGARHAENNTRRHVNTPDARSIKEEHCYANLCRYSGMIMRQTKLAVVMAGGSGSRLWRFLACCKTVSVPEKGDLLLQTTICRLNGVECESGGYLQRTTPFYRLLNSSASSIS